MGGGGQMAGLLCGDSMKQMLENIETQAHGPKRAPRSQLICLIVWEGRRRLSEFDSMRAFLCAYVYTGYCMITLACVCTRVPCLILGPTAQGCCEDQKRILKALYKCALVVALPSLFRVSFSRDKAIGANMRTSPKTSLCPPSPLPSPPIFLDSSNK